MKAMQFLAYGGPERLAPAELPMPQPDIGQLLVKVAAAAVNPIDWKLHGGLLRWVRPVRFPSVPCFDFAGEVAATGAEVTGFQPGERVFGMLPMRAFGSAAEYLRVDARYVAPLPETIGFQEAAGMPLAGMTALQGLRDRGRLAAGHKVLIVGASGGVGHYAVQIAKILGAEVAAVCGARNLELARELGADRVIDYAAGDGKPPAGPFDLIFDAVVDRRFEEWRGSLAEEGRYVSVLPNLDLLRHSLLMPLYSRRRVAMAFVEPKREDLLWLAERALEGRLRTVVDSVRPLSELGAALEKSRSGRARGKIVVTVDI